MAHSKVKIECRDGHRITLVVREWKQQPYICGVILHNHPNLNYRALRAACNLDAPTCNCVAYYRQCFMIPPAGILHGTSSSLTKEARRALREENVLLRAQDLVYEKRKQRSQKAIDRRCGRYVPLRGLSQPAESKTTRCTYTSLATRTRTS